MKKQIIVIHGGDTFASHEEYIKFLKEFEIDFERYRGGKTEWKQNLQKSLGEDYQVYLPQMPGRSNAKYAEWKIWFEKLILYFELDAIFIGHSLGGIFLAKYLSEHELPKKPRAVFLVAAPYDTEGMRESLADFVLSKNLSLFNAQCRDIFFYHSTDDPVVPFAAFEKYVKTLPSGHAQKFTDRGHFNQESFPELVADIKKLG